MGKRGGGGGCLDLGKGFVVCLVNHQHHLEDVLVLLRIRVEREHSRLLLLAAVGELGFRSDARVSIPCTPKGTRRFVNRKWDGPRSYQRTNCFGDATRFPTIFPTIFRISVSGGDDVTSGGLRTRNRNKETTM
jgi:hypothetical protein